MAEKMLGFDVAQRAVFSMRFFFIFGTVMVLACALLAGRVYLRSVISPPSGPYSIGTFTLQLNDPALVPARTIPVHLWYPSFAQPSSFLHRCLEHVTGNSAKADVPVLAGRHPVLLFFPGWGARPEENASLLQDLASFGFVVAGVAYPRGDGFPDPLVPMHFESDAAYAAGIAQGNRMVQIQAEDASAVLNKLEKLDQADPDHRFENRLDTRHVGVLGYSLGGSVAAQSALQDSRFQAVMNLDGWMFGDVATHFFSQPYLVISDGLPQPTAHEIAAADPFLRNFSGLRVRDRKQQDLQLDRSRGFRVTIEGSDHFIFSDTALVKDQPKTVTISPRRAMLLVRAYARQFFSQYLMGKEAPLLQPGAKRTSAGRVETFPASAVNGL